MATGSAISLPRPGFVPNPYEIYVDRIVVTADSDATTDLYDLIINDADADTDTNLPIFILPEYAYVHDVGVRVVVAATANAEIIVGDYLDSDGWLGSDLYEGSDTNVGIIWGSLQAVGMWNVSTAQMDSTSAWAESAYGALGGKPGLYDTSSTSGQGQYTIFMHQKEAVMEAGTVEFWIKWGVTSMNRPFLRDSDIGSTGD